MFQCLSAFKALDVVPCGKGWPHNLSNSSFAKVAIKLSFMHQNAHANPLLSYFTVRHKPFTNVRQKQGMHNCKVRKSSEMRWGSNDLDGIYQMHETGLVNGCLLYAQVKYHSQMRNSFPTIVLNTLHPKEFKGQIRLWGIPIQLWKGPLCLGIEVPFVVSALRHSGF